MDLTTIARVKAMIGETTVDNDVLLSRLVSEVSADAQRYMALDLGRAERVDVIQVQRHERLILLPSRPVDDTQTFQVRESWKRTFSSVTPLTAGSHYVLDAQGGALRLMYTPTFPINAETGRVSGPTFIQVTYTAGVAATPDAFVVAWPDVAGAVEMQVVHMFRRLSNPGGSTKLGDSASFYEDPYKLLPATIATLNRRRRRSVA